MHLRTQYTGTDLPVQATATPPFGPGFTADHVAQPDTLEMWVTTLEAPPNTTIWRLLKNLKPLALAQAGDF